MEFPQEPTKRRNKAPKKARRFAYVPLHDDWGYRAMSLAGSGAGIVLHALYVQRTTGKGEVPITATVLRRCDSRPARTRTLQRLVKAGLPLSVIAANEEAAPAHSTSATRHVTKWSMHVERNVTPPGDSFFFLLMPLKISSGSFRILLFLKDACRWIDQ